MPTTCNLQPLLVFEPSTYEGQTSWVVADEGRPLDSTDYPEVGLTFDRSGRLLSVGAYNP